MACRFSIPFVTPVDEIILKAKEAIEKEGGTFNNENNSGSFSFNKPVHIEGTFSIDALTVNIVITKKPWLISCGLIEQQLRELDL